ncbi:DNA polymerase III subunit chi [Erythrobacter sp. HKB08]|uniref:DNA polymerase III subunit chi n=1 Tax=Erythrobacter sp. HKB08 TaxID=2502843 RepID=UPI001008ECDE|nr:DNA polymerase III subunit chi [Erythrobacter sp. HKB08]
MRVDFYQLSRDPVEKVTALLAGKVVDSGGRLLVVSDEAGQLDRVEEALWAAHPPEFLANGRADAAHAERQPILLSATCDAANEARMILFADGKWREEARQFDRAFLLFDDSTIEQARSLWREMDGQERNFWKQDGARWVKAA